ncbi:hypothetical protein LIER_14568 [Lithospermum erythrorhizon]|uniref:Uncharacterized protein n=1 Tax=Lithospermum erythrorhizon TaxID=34254 RepID=A0AAV3Q253_LITER
MASLNSLFISIPPATTQRRVLTAATATKSSGEKTEEKGLLDFILGGLTKQDQFYETDPILKKVEDNIKSGGTTSGLRNTVVVPPKKNGGGRMTSGRQNTVVVPPKKNGGGGGFGGLGVFLPRKIDT